MAPKFGTSGLRGLVVDLTPALVAGHVRGFARACDCGGRLMLGRDLRASSPRIAAWVAAAARDAGLAVTDCGRVPTPALALAAREAGAAAVMVTGSHIPDDRNGLKFYTPQGEITKADEAAILAALAPDPGPGTGPAAAEAAALAAASATAAREAATRRAYVARYLDGCPAGALAGLRIGLYEHSSVARAVIGAVLEGLGATVLRLGRSERFVAVDTEAVEAPVAAALAGWAAEHRLDALVSADGDGDRPLVADAEGQVVPGDLLGLLTAHALGVAVVVTPVSSTTALERSGAFVRVRRTRIGSPHVIAGIAAERAVDPAARVAGFEANGGFLLGFDARLPGGAGLAMLPTRDAVLPIVAPLMLARAAGHGLAGLLAGLPARHTAAGRLADVDPVASTALLARVEADPALRSRLLGAATTSLDRTDGLRYGFAAGHVLHLRASGNAPELRCYGEADSAAAAAALVARTLARLTAEIRRPGTPAGQGGD